MLSRCLLEENAEVKVDLGTSVAAKGPYTPGTLDRMDMGLSAILVKSDRVRNPSTSSGLFFGCNPHIDPGG